MQTTNFSSPYDIARSRFQAAIDRGMSQSELARFIGIPRSTFSDFMRGVRSTYSLATEALTETGASAIHIGKRTVSVDFTVTMGTSHQERINAFSPQTQARAARFIVEQNVPDYQYYTTASVTDNTATVADTIANLGLDEDDVAKVIFDY